MLSTGTCINNTSVMMFKKGSFEIGCNVYPVAIKVVTSFCFISPLMLLLPTADSFLSSCDSMILALEMLSGTAVSLAW